MSVNERRNPDASVITPLRLQIHFHLGKQDGCAVNNYTGISPIKYGNPKHPLEQAAPVQAHATGQSHHQRCHGAQGCLLSGIVTTFPVLFSIEALILGLCESLNTASLFLII